MPVMPGQQEQRNRNAMNFASIVGNPFAGLGAAAVATPTPRQRIAPTAPPMPVPVPELANVPESQPKPPMWGPPTSPVPAAPAPRADGRIFVEPGDVDREMQANTARWIAEGRGPRGLGGATTGIRAAEGGRERQLLPSTSGVTAPVPPGIFSRGSSGSPGASATPLDMLMTAVADNRQTPQEYAINMSALTSLANTQQNADQARVQFSPEARRHADEVNVYREARARNQSHDEALRQAREAGAAFNTLTGRQIVTTPNPNANMEGINRQLAIASGLLHEGAGDRAQPTTPVPIGTFITNVPDSIMNTPEGLARVLEYAQTNYPGGAGGAQGFLNWFSANTPGTGSVEFASDEAPRQRLARSLSRQTGQTSHTVNPSWYRTAFPNVIDTFAPGAGQYRTPLNIPAITARLRSPTASLQAR